MFCHPYGVGIVILSKKLVVTLTVKMSRVNHVDRTGNHSNLRPKQYLRRVCAAVCKVRVQADNLHAHRGAGRRVIRRNTDDPDRGLGNVEVGGDDLTAGRKCDQTRAGRGGCAIGARDDLHGRWALFGPVTRKFCRVTPSPLMTDDVVAPKCVNWPVKLALSC